MIIPVYNKNTNPKLLVPYHMLLTLQKKKENNPAKSAHGLE